VSKGLRRRGKSSDNLANGKGKGREEPVVPGNDREVLVHQVLKSDSLAGVALKYGTTVRRCSAACSYAGESSQRRP
jgi:hypothetical protein